MGDVRRGHTGSSQPRGAVHFDDPRRFYETVRPAMERREVENSLFLGVAKQLADSPARAFMMVVQTNDSIRAAALRVAPYQLSVCAVDGEAAEQLAEAVLEAGEPCPAVIGLRDRALRFAERWAARTGQQWRTELEMTFYRLGTLVRPASPPPGALRPASTEDQTWLVDWFVAFAEEVGLPAFERDPDHAATVIRRKIAASQLFVWEHRGRPVSVVGFTPTGINGARIGPVSTNAADRGRGYGGAAVAALSQRLLKAGNSWCGVFADISNPASNRLYQRLGYRRACDVRSIAFAGSPTDESASSKSTSGFVHRPVRR